MTKLSRVEFAKQNKEYIQHIFCEVLEFINSQEEIHLRNDKESFRMSLINYLYNIYLNEYDRL
tara:strand:- start:227 stop:415 length:189 start_codon:yes stop_codon:yes gene_type:complete